MSADVAVVPDGGVDPNADVSSMIEAKKEYIEARNTPGEVEILFKEYATEKMIPKWGFGDTINLIFVIIPLVIPLAIFTIIYNILVFPPAFIGYLYTLCLKKPVRRLEGCGFQFICLILLPLSIPAIIVIWLWVFLVWFYSFFVSMPFGILRIIFLCEGPVIYNNFRLIWKQMKPMPFHRWTDVCRAVLGCIYRQGIWEYMSPRKFLQGGAGGYLISVIVKYALTVNPWLYTLEEQYCNQWSPPAHGDPSKIAEALLEMVSYSLPSRNDRRFIDQARFAPHYPFPPGYRSDAIGSQFGESLKYSTFTKTTFQIDLKDIPEERSKDMERNVFYVELTYTNPFHFLTGDVYVGRRKDMRWEHPMYCVQPKVGWFATYFYSGVNELFRVWVPTDAAIWVEKHAEGQQITTSIL